MSQSKTQSLVEVIINVVVGYVIATFTQIIIFPMFDIHIGLGDQMMISLVFTIISIIRGYVIRRWFNARIHKFAGKF